MNEIKTISKAYYKMSLWVVCGSMLLALFIMQVARLQYLVNAALVSAVYSFVCNLLYGQAWKATARTSPNSLAKFYLAASGLRMLASLIVVVLALILLRPDRQMMLGFSMIFVAFYLVMLLFDTIFFTRIERKHKIK